MDEVIPNDGDNIYIVDVASVCELRLSDVTDPLSSSGHVIRVRAARFGTGISLTARLFDGGTQIASFSVSLGPLYSTRTYILTGTEADNIGDYTNLRIKLDGNATGLEKTVLVSWVEFEVPDGAGHTHTPGDSGHPHGTSDATDLGTKTTGLDDGGRIHTHPLDPDGAGHIHGLPNDGTTGVTTGVTESHSHTWTLPNHDHGNSENTDEATVTTDSADADQSGGPTTIEKWIEGSSGSGAVVRDTGEVWSGDYVAKFTTPAGGPTDIALVYQDIEVFDPLGTGPGGTNISIRARTSTSTQAPIKLKVYDHGTFDNPTEIIGEVTLFGSLNTWEEFTGTINRSSFRLVLEMEGQAGANTVYVDDVIFHPEPIHQFYLLDPSEEDTDFSSSFLPQTNFPSTAALHFLDDIEDPPETRAQRRRGVNTAIVIRQSAFGGRPSLAISRNVGDAERFGTILDITESDALRGGLDEQYRRAKQEIRLETRHSNTFTLIGQYPFLFSRSIRLFLPRHGFPDPHFVEVSGLRLGPDYTEVMIERADVQQFEDAEEAKERRKFLKRALEAEVPRTLFYFAFVDLPKGIDVTDVAKATLVDENSVAASSNKDLEEIETDRVWRWVVGPQDGTDWDSTTKTVVWTKFRVQDGASATLADISFNPEFAKLKEQTLEVWLFAR